MKKGASVDSLAPNHTPLEIELKRELDIPLAL
jgi:hypothetical protein